MSNRILMPILNPLRWVDESKVNLVQYFTKQFDDYLFAEQILVFEQKVKFFQQWSPHDIVSWQYSSNYSPIQISFVSACDGSVPLTFTASSNIRNAYEPDYWLYEMNIDISALPEGVYFIRMEAGLPVQKSIRSENFMISSDIDNTILIEYQNSEYYGDIIFETGIKLGLRIPAILKYDSPGSKDVVYEDQVLNNTVLNSVQFRNFKLFIGRQPGIPPWMIDKISRALGCDNVTLDGNGFSKADGASWEKTEEEYYPMQGWSIQLREAINRKSIIFDSEGDTNKKIVVVGNIDSKGFGDIYAPGQNVVPITELE